MSWIKTIPYEEAEGKLKEYYDRISGPDQNIDNIMLVHSLRPHTLMAHMMLYKSVLHHSDNVIPKYLLESIGIYVSHLNRCYYCVEHHYEGLKKLLNDNEKAVQIREALERNKMEEVFDQKSLAMLHYARELTKTPYAITKDTIEKLRDMGVSDGELLEVNQLVSYFNYANRTVLGLGVNTIGDVLGTSPSESDNDSWTHR